LPLAFRRRRKAGPAKREELFHHLQEIGIEAALMEKGSDKEKVGLSRSSGQRSEGIIELKNADIDFINVVSVASQYGTHYFIDYLVKSPNIIGERALKKTRLVRRKSRPIRGEVVAIDWKGDNSLAQSLALDYTLEDKLLRVDASSFKGNIWIFPEPKHGYVRIRTDYSLPSTTIFEAISSIARHAKSW
jgi:hypothetical protein